jgi:hypothetical protein
MSVGRSVLLAIVIVGSFAVIARADDPIPSGTQTGIGYRDTAHCDSDAGLKELGESYYGSGLDLQKILGDLFNACPEFTALETDPYKVVVFLAKPTPAADSGTVAHFIFNQSSPIAPGFTILPGIDHAAWVYITEDDKDSIVSQLTTTAIDNPLFTALGSLASGLGEKIVDMDFHMYSLTQSTKPSKLNKKHKLILHVAKSVNLRGQRSSLAEADYISSPLRNEKNEFISRGDQPKVVSKPVFEQITGSFAMTNTPLTHVTVNGGFGVIVLPTVGAKRMKVDDTNYASDPIPLGMTFAGVTFHRPYSDADPVASNNEKRGWFLGGVITPSAGIATGYSIGVRGIALVVGGAIVWVDTSIGGAAAGTAIPAGADPQLVKRPVGAFFVGATYAFSK